MNDHLTTLKTHLARVADLSAAANVLEWDQETHMPDGAAEARAHQIATLRELAHTSFVSDAVGELLDRLAPLADEGDPDAIDTRLVRVTRRDYDRARKLPARLVADLAAAVSLGKQAWKEARETDTFATFAPALERILDLTLEKADRYGYDAHPYDALLDEYEPGLTTEAVRTVFEPLREELVPLVHAIAGRPAPPDDCLRGLFPYNDQWDFGVQVIRDFGYDFNRGRQDVSAHPFTTAFSADDVRVTTRIDEHFFPPGFFGTLHEAGHGLYEQGIAPDLARTPLADGTSLAMHESQSRLWENQVGRSLAFWEHYFPQLQLRFPDALRDVDLDDFYRAINRVEPSLIRVEADEVTYNLHIMLRFELEVGLVEGTMAVADLPAIWNDRMESYLGIVPPSDADGVLQDVHWSLGAIGYFPTYTLGTLLSAQLFEQAETDLGDLDAHFREGRFDELLAWLRQNIHRHGRARTADELTRVITGEPLQSESWLRYAREKFGALYGV